MLKMVDMSAQRSLKSSLAKRMPALSIALSRPLPTGPTAPLLVVAVLSPDPELLLVKPHMVV
jgi:hypothetical protein